MTAMENHRPDLYDRVELSWPSGLAACPALPSWLTVDVMPCPDCRANLFLRWSDGEWFSTVAHDDGCPFLASVESDGEGTVGL